MIKRSKQKTNSPHKVGIKTSASNLFLNASIILLSIVIVYLIYSIVMKLSPPDPEFSEAKELKPAEIIQLEVLNGCGAGGVADLFTSYLRDRKFDVVNVSNYISFDIDRTMVIDRTGNMANAQKVAEMLGVEKENVFQQINNDYFLDVSVIIGRDYKRLLPK